MDLFVMDIASILNKSLEKQKTYIPLLKSESSASIMIIGRCSKLAAGLDGLKYENVRNRGLDLFGSR